MNRFASVACATLLGLTLLAACGEEMTDADAGAPDAGPVDSGSGEPDAGPREPDAGPPDAGPQGCQTGCGFEELALGILHACGRRENGEVLCWGRNQELQLGDGRTRHDDCAPTGTTPEDCSGLPVNVRWDNSGPRPIIEDATAITVQGFSATCAMRGGEGLWCWSQQTVPDVAGGIPRQRPVAEPEDLGLSDIHQASVGGSHLCFVQGAERAVYCVGSNTSGQLGTGEFAQQVVDPVQVLLDPAATPPVGLDGAEEVVVSHGGFTCARTASDVYCWGSNDNDQLGDGSDTSHHDCVLEGENTYDCSAAPVLVGGEATPLGAVSDLGTGGNHVCAVQSADGSPGQVVCWGDNRRGQTGQPDTMETVGLPTEVASITDAVQVATGSGFSCARRQDGTVWCWGLNLHGQLGDGVADHGTRCESGATDADCSRTPVQVAGIDDAQFLAANASFACAVRGDGSVWCWGNNNNRQLGDGTRENRGTPVMVLGTAP